MNRKQLAFLIHLLNNLAMTETGENSYMIASIVAELRAQYIGEDEITLAAEAALRLLRGSGFTGNTAAICLLNAALNKRGVL